MIELNKIYNEDCLEGMKRIPDGSVDCILTDPPYLYLKNQKLDRPFDELVFFSECKRVLKKTDLLFYLDVELPFIVGIVFLLIWDLHLKKRLFGIRLIQLHHCFRCQESMRLYQYIQLVANHIKV